MNTFIISVYIPENIQQIIRNSLIVCKRCDKNLLRILPFRVSHDLSDFPETLKIVIEV